MILSDWWWGTLFVALGTIIALAVEPANIWSLGSAGLSALIGCGFLARHLERRDFS